MQPGEAAGRYVTDVNVFLQRLLASRMDPQAAPVLSAPGAPLDSLDAIDQKGGPGLVHRQACHQLQVAPAERQSFSDEFSCVPSSGAPLCSFSLHRCPKQVKLATRQSGCN